MHTHHHTLLRTHTAAAASLARLRPALAGLGLLAAVAAATTAHAQWTATILHPAGANHSRAIGVSGGEQVGYAYVNPGNVSHASLWNGTAASWVNLEPAGVSSSFAYGVSDGQQVGEVRFATGGSHASLWSGTAASWVDLNPAVSSGSFAFGVAGGQQVGSASIDGQLHAGLWSGTAASWVDLNPAGGTESYAFHVSGGQQVGYVKFGGPDHAGLWSGTAASWVDLSPAGSPESYAYGVSGGQQVGLALIGGAVHAGLWNGTAASWVDLNPPGFVASNAIATFGGQQVGSAFPSVGGSRAALWSGTAASFVDLHAFLPAEIGSSHAWGIWGDANFIYVVGYGTRVGGGEERALLWTLHTGPREIDYYQVSKLSRFTQTSAAPPATVDSWQVIGFLQHSPDAVTSASISFAAPAPTTVPMTQGNPLLHLYYSDEFASQSAMNLAYPSTTYTFHLNRGAGPESANLFLPPNLFCPETPHMTGDTYARLQNYNASQPFDLHINGFAAVPGANEVHTTIQIVGGGVVFVRNVPNTDTVVTIPAGTLLPATSQTILIEYASSVETPNAGFGTARSFASFIRDTSATFTTRAACAADFNIDGVVSVQDIFDFLAAWFASDPRADINSVGGITVQDIFDFLGAWFAGC